MIPISNDLKEILSEVSKLINNKSSFKITFSKPRPQNKNTVNTFVKPVLIKNKIQYSFTFRYKNKDEVKNFDDQKTLSIVEELALYSYFNLVVISEEKELTMMQNKKGNSRIIEKKQHQPIHISIAHDEDKNRMITAEKPFLHHLGLASAEGNIYDKSQAKYRQINKYVEVINHLIKDFPADSIIKIADMGSGKGYLTFGLYDYLMGKRGAMGCRMTGYELREDLATASSTLALQLGWVGLSFQQSSIDEAVIEDVDMVIALHACDIATDMAIAKGINSNAQYIVVSPCCHKQIRKDMKSNGCLGDILSHGILMERQAEILTDGLRSLILEAHGYKTSVFEFISSEETSKNLMITAIKGKINPKAAAEIKAIKEAFGIGEHHLEKLITA